MSLAGTTSPNFLLHSSKSTGNTAGANQTAYDIIEHDVADLTKIGHLPSPDSFDALHIGCDR